MFCPYCGNKVMDDSQFCNQCGKKLPSSEPQENIEKQETSKKQGNSGKQGNNNTIIFIVLGIAAFIVIAMIAIFALFIIGRKAKVITDKENDVKTETIVEESQTDAPEEVPAKETVSDDEWKSAYLSYLRQMDSAQKASYVGAGFIYVNDDDLPELVLEGDCEATGCLVLTYADGQVDELFTARLSFDYIERKNMLRNAGGNMGFYYDYLYEIKDGKWEQSASGEYGGAGDESTYEYSWNGAGVSKKEYDEILSSAYPVDDATCFDDFKSVSEIEAELNTSSQGAQQSTGTKSIDELFQDKMDELGYISLDAYSYDHSKGGESYYSSTGLAPTEGTFANYFIDLDADGQDELVSFSLHYKDEDGYNYHEIMLTIFEATDKAVVLADELSIAAVYEGSYDKGDFRVMIKDGKYLCIDESSFCCLEGDGAGVSMMVLTYDGNSISTYADAAYNGSDWYEAGSFQREFISKLNAIGLTRTAYLMKNTDHYYFSTADYGLQPLFKVHAELLGEYDDYVLKTQLSMITADGDDYLLPDSASRVLDKSEIKGLSKEQLRIARNEIYARYGWNFEDEGLDAYFSSKVWYRPNFDVGNITDSDLTDIEIKNRDAIIKME